MESTPLLHHGGLKPLLTTRKLVTGFRASNRNRPTHRHRVCSVMAEHKSDGVATGPVIGPAEGFKETVYEDNWFDRLAIHHLSQAVQSTTGMRNEKEGYESLIEAASSVARRFNAEDQQVLVIEALKKAFPRSILATMQHKSGICYGRRAWIRTLTPPSKFSREFFAVFTTMFFPWLVGKCETGFGAWNYYSLTEIFAFHQIHHLVHGFEVRESESQGRREKNVVYIPKCRFLEETKCAGMCTNMCKIPSQKFIKDSLGISVHMAPNFDDMSCEMIFGLEPPEDDPALKQPCYKKLCVAKQTHGVKCSS